MRKVIISILWAVLVFPVELWAQGNGVVKGKVTDAKTGDVMEFVNVGVRKTDSPTPLTGTITDQTGRFQIGNLEKGNYVLVVSFIGYASLEKGFAITEQKKEVNFPALSLKEDRQMLGEVTVAGQRSQMKFEIDKKVFNVDQNIASTGGTASDVLSNIPSVEVDNEGEVSLRGSTSVTVWINGKASGLSADNRAQILEQLPAESIEKIEVITNPSAKYSPEGTSGIINIVLKQDRKAGYYGSLQAGADTRGGWNTSGNINYNSGKVDAYASLGYRRRVSNGGGISQRNNLNENGDILSYLNQYSDNDGHGGPLFVRSGLTYHLTKQDHFTLGAFGMFGERYQKRDIRYESDAPGAFTERNRISESDNDMNGRNVELGYKHDFSEKSNLDIMLSWNKWDMDGTSTYRSFFADERESFQRQKNNIRSQDWEIQADYVNEFSKTAKLEAGYKGTLSRHDSPVETYSGVKAEDAKLNPLLYNLFLYDQDVHAAYTTYSGRIEKFGFQLGLRGEYSKVNTKSLGYGQTEGDKPWYKEDYFSLFPTAFLSYELPAGHEVQLNYSRRISRPGRREINPFLDITDSTNISFGNPYLKPQYSNSLELNYIKNWDNHTLSVSLYYRNTDDVIQRISYMEEQVMKSTFENVAKTQSAGAEFVVKNNFARILDLTTTVNLFYSKLDGFSYLPEGADKPVVGRGNEDFSWNARMIANVALPASFSLQLTGNYNARQLIAQGFRNPSYSLDAGLRKSFWNKKFSVSVNGRDLLNSQRWKMETSGAGFAQYAENWRTGRTIGATLTYSFGNMKRKPQKSQSGKQENNSMNYMGEDF